MGDAHLLLHLLLPCVLSLRQEVDHLLPLLHLPLEPLNHRPQLGAGLLQLRCPDSEAASFLRRGVELLEQPLLLRLPGLAVAGEDLHHPGVGLGVLLPPGLHEAQLLLGAEELHGEGAVAVVEGGEVGLVGSGEQPKEDGEAET